MAKKSLPSVSKSKTILEDGEVRGKPLSTKQKGLFGMIAGGGTPSKKGGLGNSKAMAKQDTDIATGGGKFADATHSLKKTAVDDMKKPIGMGRGSSSKYARMMKGAKK